MDGDLRNMVMSFRVTELQTLLGYAGKNRSGRKNELQARALELVRCKSSPIVAKIKELYRSMQQSIAHQTSAATTAPPTAMTSSGNYNSNNSGMNQQRLFTGSTGYNGSSEKILQGINSFNVAYNGHQKPLSVSMPICPDVKMKRLPFYDILSELMKPTSLMPQGMGRCQEASHSFCLTPQQAADIAASKEYVAVSMGDQKLQYTKQVQLRFSTSDTSVEQEDQFPPNIVVKVNGKLVPLPHPIPSNRSGVEAKRPSRPLNVTNFVRLSPTITNTISVQWASDNTKGYVMSLYLVKKLTSSDLLGRLKGKGVRPADFSRGMIKELIAKDDGDCMIAMTSLKVTVACPLGKCKMILPCRATTCKHLQCFDASLFLQMNERKPTWVCPVCDKPTLFEDLCIDGYFQEVIGKMSNSSSMDVELLPDGSWKPITHKNNKKDKDEYSPPTKKLKADSGKLSQTINLDDDIVIDEEPLKIEPASEKPEEKKKKPNGSAAEVIDLTLDSSSDDEEIVNVRPRRKLGNPKYVIDDDSSSSSSSSSTSDGSARTNPNSPATGPRSPACITLDSRSPSPEPASARTVVNGIQGQTSGNNNNNGSGGISSGGTFSSISTRTAPPPPIIQLQQPVIPTPTLAASTSISRSDSRPSSSTSFDYGHGHNTLGQPSGYPTRSNSSHNQNQPSISPNLYPSGGYLPSPFDGPWGAGNTNTYPNPFATPDFSQLDFPSLDYFNTFDPRGGNSGGYGRWT